MSENIENSDSLRVMFADSAQRLFAGLCDRGVVTAAEEGEWPQTLWHALEELGVTRAVLPEAQDGAGIELADIMPVIRLAGEFAAPVPLAETVIAGWLLAQAGLPVATGPLAFAPTDRRRGYTFSRAGDDWQLDGVLRNVPWGDRAGRITLVADTGEGAVVAAVDPALATVRKATNLAGESRVQLVFNRAVIAASDVARAPKGMGSDTAYLYGAVIRIQQMAGALRGARDMAVRYASERIAFGKPLNKLQAVQQNLAVLAGHSAAANVAADMVMDALANPAADLQAAVALARVRVNDAAEIGARLAHQVHGAIGFTYEHRLHQVTRRLWSWRDEFGNDAHWAELVGRQIIDGGDEKLWANITGVAQL